MIGYFDPDSLKVGEADAVISFINAADGNDIREVSIRSSREAKRVMEALKDQLEHGVAGLNGQFRKVQGTFTRLPGNNQEGIILDPASRRETPVRLEFEVKPGELPGRGICIALGEMVSGALMVDRMTIAPIAPMPAPPQAMQDPDS